MDADDHDNLNDVAIIGMDGRFPGAPDLERFWENLRNGVESTTFLSREKPVVRRGMAWVKAAPVVEDIELFDARFFGFNPREAETMDPQIRLFLECAWVALERAGYARADYPGRVGVFAGSAASTYLTQNLIPNHDVMRKSGGAFSSLGVFNDRDSLATLASYKLDLTGPAVTVQTFCSTSLVAVHLACQSLLNGESDVALAGSSSINVGLGSGYLYTEGSILSPDGHCRTFDAGANGTVFGNGVGVVVLRRLADALEDGDPVQAVIRGSAINNDGARKAGYTAPSVVGQSKAIAEALSVAQVSPESIGYVEAHGTATSLGDPIEIEALTRAFRAGTDRTGYCAIGSVKANFGHLDRAAGVAALIKTVLMLQHRQIPPSLHYERPNPKIDFESSPFRVATELSDWKAEDGPRRAGVSSLGFGGTNAHVVLEEAPERDPSGPSRASQLLVLSARTATALDAATSRLAQHLRAHPETPLADVAYTLLMGRRRFEHRRVAVAATSAEAAGALDGPDAKRVQTLESKANERPVAFMFPGQGAQYVGMTRGLYEGEPVFRRHLDECCDLLTPDLGVDLRSLLFASPEESAAADRLRQTAIAQPALVAVETALARLWMEWGVEPQAMIGHSVGEYVAAHIAGVLDLAALLGLVAERGRLMQALPGGSMLAVHLSQAELEGRLSAELSLAAVNAPGLCVVSGTDGAVDALEARLAEEDVPATRLHTSHAFHSAMMDPVLDPFRERLRRVELRPPQVPYVSNVTGAWVTPEEATDPEYWVTHLRSPVRFASGVAALWEDPARVLLEVGPGNALSSLARAQATVGDGCEVAASIRHPRDAESDLGFLQKAVGRLWMAGVPLDGDRLFAGERRHRVTLPAYPFERERHWIDAPDRGKAAAADRSAKRPDVSDWFYVPVWKSSAAQVLPGAAAPAEPSRWLVFGDAGGFSDAIVRHIREAGEEAVVVRPGPKFGGDRRRGFQIDPASRAEHARLLEEVGSEGRPVGRIVHAWSVGSERAGSLAPDRLASGQELGFYSLMHLAHAIVAKGWSHTIQLKVLSSQMHSVLRGERGSPEKAPLLGAVKVIPQELPNVTCASLDLSGPDAPDPSSPDLDSVVEDLRGDVPGLVVAYRLGQRFVQGYEPVRLPEPEGRPARLREGATYLVTGGLGGVTFVLASYLAQAAKARLILTGRTPLPPREQWGAWRASHGSADPVSRKIGRVQALEKLGAEVHVAAADVSSTEQMRAAVQEGENRFGPIRGVIHGAGVVTGDTFRPVDQLGRSQCEEQFRSKVAGLMVLESVLAGRDLDFCVLTSSLSSVLGGLAYAAYAAANVFMDAYTAEMHARGGLTWTSVNWDEWRLGPADADAGESGLARYAMAPREGAAAFARILALSRAPQVVVSTGDLSLRIDQWVRLEALRRAKRDEKKADETARQNPRPQLQNAYVAPGTPAEQNIARIWAELLGVEKVGVQDNFFDLGGHSLLAIQAVNAIRRELNAEVSVASLFEGPTVASLAALIQREGGEQPGFDRSSDRGRRRKEERRRRHLERVEERS